MIDYDYSPTALGAPELPEGHYYRVKLRDTPHERNVGVDVWIMRERRWWWDERVMGWSVRASTPSESNVKYAIGRAGKLAHQDFVDQVTTARAEGSFK